MDENVFVYEPPLWFIVESRTEQQPHGVTLFDPSMGVLIGKDKAGQKCIPVFTDEDLARRFAMELKAKGMVRYPVLTHVATWADFFRFLTEVQMKGCTQVNFDPDVTSKVPRWVTSVPEEMNHVQQKLRD